MIITVISINIIIMIIVIIIIIIHRRSPLSHHRSALLVEASNLIKSNASLVEGTTAHSF